MKFLAPPSRSGGRSALVQAAALRPGAITAMINYYRALLRHRDSVNLGDGRVNTPTLMIWGVSRTASQRKFR